MSDDLNPYSCVRPGNLFTGYDKIRRSIVAGVLNERSYAVIGGHRCGKTSLLLQLCEDLSHAQHEHFRILPKLLNIKDLKPRSEQDFF